MKTRDRIGYQSKWTIQKYADDRAYGRGEPFEVAEVRGNLLLNEGIGALLGLLTGAAETAYDNAGARLGVGDSSTAEDASQTGLQGANTLYKAMDTGYPSVSGQTVTFRSVFDGTEANWDWNEFGVDNGASAGKNLNRKVSAQGTKASGQTWTLKLDITFS
jgi:hypothetical protein